MICPQSTLLFPVTYHGPSTLWTAWPLFLPQLRQVCCLPLLGQVLYHLHPYFRQMPVDRFLDFR